MISRARAVLLIPAILVALIGASDWRIYAAWQQGQKNAGLIAAIKREDVRAVESSLDQGADPNCSDIADQRTLWQQLRALFLRRTHARRGTPALLLLLNNYPPQTLSAYQQIEPMLLSLLRHGADPNVSDAGGWTPLNWACLYDDKPLVQLELGLGTGVNVPDDEGHTPLMVAALCADVETVRALCVLGADVNVKDKFGDSALLFALHRDAPSPAVVKVLLDRGADVNVKGSDHYTPLTTAVKARRPNPAIISMLLDHGANSDVQVRRALLKHYGARE